MYCHVAHSVADELPGDFTQTPTGIMVAAVADATRCAASQVLCWTRASQSTLHSSLIWAKQTPISRTLRGAHGQVGSGDSSTRSSTRKGSRPCCGGAVRPLWWLMACDRLHDVVFSSLSHVIELQLSGGNGWLVLKQKTGATSVSM